MNSVELKARAYDLLAAIEGMQAELRKVNQAIRLAMEEENASRSLHAEQRKNPEKPSES